ncbi:MAG: UvrD-helicase domain-containing protein [Zetaproteobacteria bacterium]|nr:UvrD-helicase domain-containing protein [Zetaproteobacteria bacterium]
MSTASLNPEQYQAVFHRGSPLLVLAGAGSGKTRVITERIAALVERDVPEDAITAVTFTNKAAKEMRERLEKRLGERTKRLRICTFHAFGLAVVREDADRVGRKANVSIFSGAEQRSAVRSVLGDLKLPTDADQVERVISRLSSSKNELMADDASILAIREHYDALLQRMNAVDFDDLMILPIKMMREHTDVRAKWQGKTRHMLVDEYQDSSRIQYEMIRLLVPDTGNLTVVGDDDQSIYGWRGADIRNLFQLDRDYPTLTVIRLEENYRSTAHILHASNSLIAKNSERMGKTLRSNLGAGKPIRVWEVETAEDEAERVAADIKAQFASSRELHWDGFCILYRASYQSRPIEMALRTAGVPYHVSGGLSFFDRAEIQDVLSYMRLMLNPDDDMAFMRAISRPRRGVGAKALGDLGDFAQEHGMSLLVACSNDELEHKLLPTLRQFSDLISSLDHMFKHSEPDDAFDTLLDMSLLEVAIEKESADEDEYNRRMGNIHELRRWWLRHTDNGGNLSEFLQLIFLLADQENEPDGQVRLMTVHAAKGLEFDHVYIIGMEEGGFPHQSALDENRLEEERRLMYVAMTRARFRLTLSRAKSRKRFGQIEKRAASPFLLEPDQENLRWVDRDIDSEDAKEEVESHMEAIRKALGL